MKKTITLIESSGGHWYKIEDPETQDFIFLPSATNILSCFPSPNLDFWRESTTPEEIKRKQEEGKIQGSKMHHCISLQIMGEVVSTNGITDAQIAKLGLTDKKLVAYLKEPLTEREEEALIGFENWAEEFKPVTIKNELMVFSGKYGFAGTLDWIGYLWNKKANKYELWIVDWKISKTLNRSYDLQIASYWKGVQETYKIKANNARLGILQLGKNACNYSFKELKNKKGDPAKDKNKAKKIAWKLFLTTKTIWDDLNPNKQPPITERRETFSLPKFTKKGRGLKIK